MKKFFKIQTIIGLMPVISIHSLYFVCASTMIMLTIHKAKLKHWITFISANIIAFSYLSWVNHFIPDEKLWLQLLAYWVPIAAINMLCVRIQTEAWKLKATSSEPTTNIVESEEKPAESSSVTNKSSSNKTVIIIVCVVGVLLVAIFIGVFMYNKINTNMQIHNESTIPDTNGADNYSPTTFTPESIVTAEEKNTMLMFGISGEGQSTLVDDEALSKLDMTERRISASEFSGVLTLQATKVASDTLSLTVKSEVSEGNLAIIVIVDGALYQSIDVNGTQTVSLSDVAGKNVLLRIAGESAKIKVEVRREY